MAQSTTELEALVGRDLGGYRLTEVIGRGSSAVIFRAQNVVQPQIERALKVVHPDVFEHTDLAARLMQEAAVHEGLHHPNIVRFYGVRLEGQLLVMELELLEGKSLSDLLGEHRSRGSRISLHGAVQVVALAACGVAAAHARGIVHRDLKPANLFVCDSGTVKVLDFGIAKVTSAALTKGITAVGTTPGSPAYVAPELLRGMPPTPASDVYSLGICLYEALAGHHPLRTHGSNPALMDLLQSALRGDIPALATVVPSLPPEVSAIVARATALQPGARYPDASALAADLAPFWRPSDSPSTQSDPRASERDATRFALPTMESPETPGLAPGTAGGGSAFGAVSSAPRGASLPIAAVGVLVALVVAGVGLVTVIVLANRGGSDAEPGAAAPKGVEPSARSPAPSAPRSHDGASPRGSACSVVYGLRSGWHGVEG